MHATDDFATSTFATVLQAWQDAFNARDVTGMTALFADDALFQGLSPNLLVGRDAIAEYYRLVPEGVRAEATPGKAHALDEHGVVGFASVRFAGTEGMPDRQARLSLTLRRNGAAWRIAMFHACESVSLA